jgi:hypothetical protein
VIDVSRRLTMEGFVIRQAEVEPARVPLCDLMILLKFYGLTFDEQVEFCFFILKPRLQS